MIKVCVLLGEGKSERAFLSSLITHKQGFIAVGSKNNIVFQSETDKDLFWIFPIPSYGQTHKGGRALLEADETYRVVRTKLLGYGWLFGTHPEFHYRVLTDTDCDDAAALRGRKDRIGKAISAGGVAPKSLEIFFSRREIEAWFIAGLNSTTFPLDMFVGAKIERMLLSSNPEELADPKKALDEALQLAISGDRIRIASDVGEYIDVEVAKSRAASFKVFIESLRRDGLLL